MTDTIASGDKVYSCFDFRLRSAIGLPELIPAEAEKDKRPLVELKLASLPEILPGAAQPGPGFQVAGDTAMLTVASVARYLIRGGGEILFDPMHGASDRSLRLFLLGSALGILCHQRGLLPLHANAIVVDGEAIAFAGPSGAGKSTLAAQFQRMGYEILCDDVCAVSFDKAGHPFAWPGLPRLKLWGDAATAFGHDKARLDRAFEGMDKYHVPFAEVGQARPIPFRRLYILGRARTGEDSSVERLKGRESMEAAMAQTYRSAYLRPMGLAGRHFSQCAALAANSGIFAASRAWGYDLLEREARRFEEHIRAGSGGPA
jgi:hypothetical protein